ncbi:MAG TPA: formate/nitrite transporter family protein [Blastocatellia bacterium]|nr:formate/nitrite transporter family protein [Blastocatellia bacterium]
MREARPQTMVESEDETGSGSVETGSPGTRLSAQEIYDNVRLAAEEEMRRPAVALLWSSLAAGLTIGFSFLAAAYLTMFVPERFANAAAAVGYPLGFMFVVLARNQLFTENTLEPIIPLLHAPGWRKLRDLSSLWITVLFGNLVGTLIFGWLTASTSLLNDDFKMALLKLATHATSDGFWMVSFRAIFAGWLIALMAWLIASTRSTTAQLCLVWLTTAPISAFGFRHSIAGSAEAFYRAAVGDASWVRMIGAFIVPAILGNIVGGILLVALLNHGQVAAGQSRD